MRPRNRTIDIFNIAMLDVIAGALGAFLILMLVFMRLSDPNVVQDLAEAQQTVRSQAEQLEELQQQLQTVERSLAEADTRLENLEEQLGVALDDKNIVFVIDASGSMVGDTYGDLFTQVKTGIKMLVANMSDQYEIDVIAFPGRDQRPYQPLWGELRAISSDGARKREIYRFLDGLQLGPYTPTGDALELVLGDRYRQAKTIVLLSDGVPSRLVGGQPVAEDRAALVAQITSTNGGRKTINTIGVGPANRYNAPHDPDVVSFLEDLAKRNGGFYMGL